MAGVDAERIGVCSWSYQRPLREVADEMAKIGVKGIDLALTPFVAPDGRHGVEEGEEALAFAKAQFASGAWRLFATMISFPQEDYSTLETIRKTGGVVPDDCWPRNREIAAAAAELSGNLGAPYMLFHAGFLDESNPAAYAAYVERVSFVRDACARAGVQLILESGQETAEDLARFLRDVPGLYVNFDPANMILYGKGRPMEALETLVPWIRKIHVKDADATAVPGTWGTERPWGEGQVGGAAFIDALNGLGFTGNMTIEREGGDDRAGDIARAAARLREGR
ncbi:MAG: sugar phosphate isomerase/epimerase [Kiritimatiellae bacterium]|nr:sugar phosphate isomerase/epimerase [Kiritimatiellia bacterium]